MENTPDLVVIRFQVCIFDILNTAEYTKVLLAIKL